MSNAQDILANAQALDGSKSIWRSVWDLVYRFVCPERATIFRQFRTPSEIQSDVWDSTAIEAADRLVSLMMAGLVPPWMKWFRLEPGDFIKDPKQRETLMPQLEIIRDGLLSALYASGFYEEAASVLLDRVVGGTGCLRLLEVNGKVKFKAIPLADFSCAEDEGGDINRVATKRHWSLRDLKRVFPHTLPQHMQELPEENRAGTSEYLPPWIVYEYDELQVDGTWECWTLLEAEAAVLDHAVQKNPRHYVTRWSKMPGTAYGRGPALRALSDIRSLNRLKELILKNCAKAVSGVYTAVDDGVLNPRTLTFQPGAVIAVASNSPNEPTLKELPNTAKFDIGQWSIEHLMNCIKQAFMLDAFGDLAKTPRSATEVSERSQQLAEQMGATIAALQRELIQPVLEHMLSIGAKHGLVPAGMKLNALVTRLDFVSQLATGQWNQDAETLVQYSQLVTQAGQIDPRSAFILDIPKSLRYLAQIKGVPQSLLRSENEISILMQHAVQSQVQQDAQNGNLTPVPDGGVAPRG